MSGPSVEIESMLLDEDTAEDFVDTTFQGKKHMLKDILGDDSAYPTAWSVVVQPEHLEVEVTYVVLA